MADLENRFKGFITSEMLKAPLTTEGEKRSEEASWRPPEDKVKPKKEKKSSKNYHPILFLVIMAFLMGIVLGGGYMYLNQVPQKKVEEVALAQPVVEQTSRPTPNTAVVSKDKVTILILNGTGIKGQAGKVQVSLEGLGYKLIDVEIADDESETTTIEYKPGIISAEDLSEIKVLLEKTYLKIFELKSNESKVDLKIITGSLKKSS